MVSQSLLLRLSLGAAIAGWAKAGCHVGDKCYVVPVTGPDAPGQPATELACTPNCACSRHRTRGGWQTHCDNQCVARVAGQPSSCHNGILTCNDPVHDVPTADKAACVPKTFTVTKVSSTWTQYVMSTWPVGLFGDGAQASAPAWGAAVTDFLKTNPVNFKMNHGVVAQRVGLLDQFASQWEHPQFPPVEVPVQNETYRNYWGHEMEVADNLSSGSFIRLRDFVFSDAPPCCYPGFCANAACDVCTAADMLIPGSDIERCTAAAAEVQPSLVL